MSGTGNVISYLTMIKDQLSISQQRVAAYILSDPAGTVTKTSKELADALQVSEASIVRFCQRLGYTGYRDFRLRLAQDQGTEPGEAVPHGIKKTDSSLSVAEKVLQIESEDIRFTSEMINEEIINQVLTMINACDKLAFFGVGSSALVASTAKEHFLQYGKACYSEMEGLSQIVLANTLGTGDLAFAFSISGASKVPIQALKIARQNGARTICMTQNTSSLLARTSDCVIPIYKKDHSIDDLGTASRIVHLAMIDAIAVAYASQRWDETTRTAKTNRGNFKEYLYGA